MQRVRLIDEPIRAEFPPHSYREQLRIPMPRVKLIDPDDQPQRRASDQDPVANAMDAMRVLGQAIADVGKVYSATSVLRAAGAPTKDMLTPWFHVTRDGPPVRAGVYQTSGDALTPAALRPWRKYFGSNAWSKACVTPDQAAEEETSLHAGAPTYYRGLLREV